MSMIGKDRRLHLQQVFILWEQSKFLKWMNASVRPLLCIQFSYSERNNSLRRKRWSAQRRRYQRAVESLQREAWSSLRVLAVCNVVLCGLAHERLGVPTVHALHDHVLNIVAVTECVGLDHCHDDWILFTRIATQAGMTCSCLQFGWRAFIDWAYACDGGGARAVVHGFL